MKKILMLTLAVLLPSSFVLADNDHLKPDGLISQEEAVTFQTIYREFKQEEGVWETSEFVFELNQLKQYIAYVEAEAERLGHSDLALRVYLAAYPPGYKDNDNAETTIFFAPATKDTGGQGHDFHDLPDTGGVGQDKYNTIYTIEPLNNGTGGSGGYPK